MMRRRGHSVGAIAAHLGLPRSTVSRWCRGDVPTDARALLAGGVPQARCASCGRRGRHEALSSEYAYLLGVYLGDGCLGRVSRTTSLRIALDLAYPAIIEEVAGAMLAVRGGGTVSRYSPPGKECVLLTSYTRAWRCLFPQHGPGRKHDRPIVLEPWQLEIVREHPGRLARGLIHSDGWRGVNRVRTKGRDYEYPRYQFSNRSDDIRTLFTDALDRLGVDWRPWGRFHISVARREAVALLDEHVGPKA